MEQNNNAQGHESGHQKYERGFEDGYNAAINHDKDYAALRAKCEAYEDLLNRSSLILMSLGYAGKLLIEINEAIEEKEDKQ